MNLGIVQVAKKKSGPKPIEGDKGARKAPDPEPRQTLFSVKGRISWLEWVDRLAAFDRSSRADLMDRALARYAKEVGFTDPPPER